MRRVNHLICLALLLTLVGISCSKDDDSLGDDNRMQIVGQWRISAVNGSIIQRSDGTDKIADFEGLLLNTRYDFRADGSCVVTTAAGETSTETYAISGDVLTFSNATYNFNGKVSISGNSMTLGQTADAFVDMFVAMVNSATDD